MKLTMLVDNNTFIDQYYHGEPAAAFYIEEGEARVLFDTGYSHILLTNAELMGVDLNAVTHIVLSHGHDDHTRGLRFLKEKIDLSSKQLICHPDCFLPKYSGDLYVGAPCSAEDAAVFADYRPEKGVRAITERLFWLGEIPRGNDFENRHPIGKVEKNGAPEDDYLVDDSALVYKSDRGLFIISGCSHSGICNIVEHAKRVCGDERVLGVLGGFHLFHDDEQLKKTIDYLEAQNIELFYPCHCVSLLARCRMMQRLPVVETGVGMVVEVE